jgi:glycosyltransferase involved in cell wall biosynthesis
LFSGKLIAKKRPLHLLEAFAAVQRERTRPAALLYVGDGELRSELEQRARQFPDLCIRFAGFLNQTRIVRAYAAADVLALPSAWGETWGLAVNEAMNYGLVPIVTDRVGCAGDLVHDGRTGFVIPVDEGPALAGALRRLLDDDWLRREMGARARTRVADWSIDHCAAGLAQATQYAFSRRGASRRRYRVAVHG